MTHPSPRLSPSLDPVLTQRYVQIAPTLIGRFARSLGLHDAEDRVHDAFLAVMELLATSKAESAPQLTAAYLYKVIVGTLAKSSRAAWLLELDRNLGRAAGLEPLAHEAPVPGHATGRALDVQHMAARVTDVMREMCKARRGQGEAINMYICTRKYFDGATAGAIAAELDLGQNAVEQRLSRFKQRVASLCPDVAKALSEGAGRGHYAGAIAVERIARDGQRTEITATAGPLRWGNDGFVVGQIALAPADAAGLRWGYLRLANGTGGEELLSVPFPVHHAAPLQVRAFVGSPGVNDITGDGIECPADRVRLTLHA